MDKETLIAVIDSVFEVLEEQTKNNLLLNTGAKLLHKLALKAVNRILAKAKAKGVSLAKTVPAKAKE